MKTKVEELRAKAREAEKVEGEKEGKMAAIVQRLLVPEKAMKVHLLLLFFFLLCFLLLFSHLLFLLLLHFSPHQVQQKAMVDTAVEKKMRDLAHLDELLAAEEESKVRHLPTSSLSSLSISSPPPPGGPLLTSS